MELALQLNRLANRQSGTQYYAVPYY